MNSPELNKDPEIVPEEKTVEQTIESAVVPEPEDVKVKEEENVTEETSRSQENAEVPIEESEPLPVQEEEIKPVSEELVAVAEPEDINVETDEIIEEKPGEEVQVPIEESKPIQTVQEEKIESVSEDTQETEKKQDNNFLTREELVQRLKELLTKDVNEIKDEVEQIKQLFYKKLKAENEEKKNLFLEAGGNEADFKAEKDELEDSLKTLLGDFKAKKAEYIDRLEKEKENNLVQKQHILEQMKALTEATDDVSVHIGEFKELQQKWKAVGMVPANMTTDLWKQYNLLQEKFWDLIKINNELREYDFKKNLEAKLALCEAAERLLDQEDVISAARQLQKFHEEWHEIGPVARESREEIWNRFKDITSQINKKHQAHFDGLRQGEEENEAQKIALCEKLEAFDVSGLKTYNAWDKATDEIKALQAEWRLIGFAPRKVNQKLFERYRQACDEFFAKKAAYYKEAKAELAENFEKKKALCEQAEALKDSTDWKETSDKLIKIQRQWKEIGPVQKKYSDELWKRFISACDYFFEQKNKNVSSQRTEEIENFKKKQEVIDKIDTLDVTDPAKGYSELKTLIEQFRNIGHVPFKEKEKIYKAYRAAVDKQFEALNIDANNRRLDSFRNNLEDMSTKGEQKLYREREKLMRTYDHLKSEIATYENNIGFFSSTSKKADSMLKEMERKIEGLKEEARLIEQKIKMIDEKL